MKNYVIETAVECFSLLNIPAVVSLFSLVVVTILCRRLLLGDIEGELSCNPSALPCVLQRLDKDGSLMKGPPGYQVKHALANTLCK